MNRNTKRNGEERVAERPGAGSSYVLDRQESVPDGLKRIAAGQLRTAAGRLREPGTDQAAAVHEARKSIKKVRAILRLARPEMKALGKTENIRLRDIGRSLSALRDADVVLETLTSLEAKLGPGFSRVTLRSIRKRLQAGAANGRQNLEETAAALEQAADGVASWPLSIDGFDGLRKGLRRTYSDGRAAMRKAVKDPADVNFHEWRKRAKDHWYHWRLMESALGPKAGRRREALERLSDNLGEEHNLVILRGRLMAASGSRVGMRQLLAAIRERQEELRESALAEGKRLYARRPRKFIGNLEARWEKNAPRVTRAAGQTSAAVARVI